jgi:formate hydrogenlyase subunit 6/NADH:ubiquinone oxidoreductase subunit I
MEALLYFAGSTLLYIVAIFFLAGTLFRGFFFVVNIFRGRPLGGRSVSNRFLTLIGVAVPYRRAAVKKPLYTTIRYAFHASVFILPIWFSGHLDLWEESRFGWTWAPLPDAWADRLTLFVLFTCVFFMGRHIISRKNRHNTRISDLMLILITGLPFLTGYLLTHGNLDSIPFFEKYLWYFHVISGEVMVAMIVFLFCRTRLNKETCVGCGACVENCPTETLGYVDKGAFRFFGYSHYRCICCGSCVSVCPESAAELHHEISLKRLFEVFSRETIRSIELERCAGCGVAVGPKPQIDKIRNDVQEKDIGLETLAFCNRCKKMMSRQGYLLPERRQDFG